MPELSVTGIAIGAAFAVGIVAYFMFIVRPAWTSYGRLWERMAASFLTLYILVAVAAVGAAVGLGIFLLYARSA